MNTYICICIYIYMCILNDIQTFGTEDQGVGSCKPNSVAPASYQAARCLTFLGFVVSVKHSSKEVHTMSLPSAAERIQMSVYTDYI